MAFRARTGGSALADLILPTPRWRCGLSRLLTGAWRARHGEQKAEYEDAQVARAALRGRLLSPRCPHRTLDGVVRRCLQEMVRHPSGQRHRRPSGPDAARRPLRQRRLLVVGPPLVHRPPDVRSRPCGPRGRLRPARQVRWRGGFTPAPQPGLTMAGRTPDALLRRMERWHAQLHRNGADRRATVLTTRAERVDLLDSLRTDCGHGAPARGGTGAR